MLRKQDRDAGWYQKPGQTIEGIAYTACHKDVSLQSQRSHAVRMPWSKPESKQTVDDKLHLVDEEETKQ
jgi:hypothetical protein